jgi:hypothetical protein
MRHAIIVLNAFAYFSLLPDNLDLNVAVCFFFRPISLLSPGKQTSREDFQGKFEVSASTFNLR